MLKAARNCTHSRGPASTDTVPDAFRVLRQYEQAGHTIDLHVLNILMNGCAKLGDLITAMRLWDAYFAPYGGGSMPEATGRAAACNRLGVAQRGTCALGRLVVQGTGRRFTPDRYTYTSFLWTCANATAGNLEATLTRELLEGVRRRRRAWRPAVRRRRD